MTSKRNGFTLVEIIIAMALLSTLMAAGVYMGSQVLRLSNMTLNTETTEDQITRIVQPMMTELRSMQPSQTGGFPIEAASSTAITFYSDTNHDGMTERIRYFIQGTTLKRGVIAPSGNPPAYNLANETISTVLTGLRADSNGIFGYFADGSDISGVPIAAPVSVQNIKAIKMTFIVTQDPNQVPAPFTYTTSVVPRNLKSQ